MTTVARPYAAAAFEYALAKQDLPAWETMLQAAAQITQDASVVQLLLSPTVSKTELADFYCDILATQLDENRKNFIRLLAENGRLLILPEIAELVKKHKAAAEQTVVVQVSSAVPLDDAYQQKLMHSLAKRFQRQVSLQCKVDPTLIGGILIRADDTVIDGTVRGKLTRLLDDSLR
jgi:F-type H+-transporting ATPase subunit delta